LRGLGCSTEEFEKKYILIYGVEWLSIYAGCVLKHRFVYLKSIKRERHCTSAKHGGEIGNYVTEPNWIGRGGQ
jgi:hypothetical protein